MQPLDPITPVKAFANRVIFLLRPWIFGSLVILFGGGKGGFAQCLSQNLFGYPDLEEVRSFLEKGARKEPSLVRLSHLGYSFRGNPLSGVTIGHTHDKDRPWIFINGAHHGDEKITVLVALGFVDFLLKNAQNPEIKKILNRYSFLIVPIINPDGYCVHSRQNAQGFDINRDYYEIDDQSKTPGFKTPEARLVSQLVQKNKFTGALALHSGDEGVYWPMGDSPLPSAHHRVLGDLARLTANKMGFERWMQSYYDYPTQGEFSDFVYKTHRILGLTVEISQEHLPRPGLHPEIVKKAVAGILAYVDALKDLEGSLSQAEIGNF